MKSNFICLHCRGTFFCNPRVKSQKYCNAKECRRASRRSWKKKNRATNKSYRQQCLQHQRVWREQRPAHEYQKQYRASHPDYVKRNRELQRERNIKRQNDPSSMIVKRNTFMVRMQILSREAMVLAQNSV
ncbi:MAG: hypothetical protein PF495_11920 [Spirochaetales bacterium]|jgi:hypothetical protein|nr:hypothetical protein [Spirochaetales bacterium]